MFGIQVLVSAVHICKVHGVVFRPTVFALECVG